VDIELLLALLRVWIGKARSGLGAAMGALPDDVLTVELAEAAAE
jgi:hypothetical protein